MHRVIGVPIVGSIPPLLALGVGFLFAALGLGLLIAAAGIRFARASRT